MISIYESAIGRAVEDVAYFEILAAVRMSLVLVRSVARLQEEGQLPAACEAGLKNPYCVMLAERLGVPPPEVGEDFQQFRQAVQR
jgi:hypothetical protein